MKVKGRKKTSNETDTEKKVTRNYCSILGSVEQEGCDKIMNSRDMNNEESLHGLKSNTSDKKCSTKKTLNIMSFH